MNNPIKTYNFLTSKRKKLKGIPENHGDRDGEVRVLRPQGGMHPRLHLLCQVQVRWQVALRPLLRGRSRRGTQTARRRGCREGPHVLLREDEVEQPCREGCRRDEADAAEKVQRVIV